MRTIMPLFLVVMLAVAAGCAGSRTVSGPYTGGAIDLMARRDVAASLERTEAARGLLGSDAVKAERLLREALDLDLYNGVAHNNLGVIFLQGGKLYEATQEFEWARKLLPGHPDPRLNLAIALQRADRPDQAIEAARSALEVQPGSLPAIQAVAVIQVQSGLTDEKTPELLADIVQRCPEPEWHDWATAARLRLLARTD